MKNLFTTLFFVLVLFQVNALDLGDSTFKYEEIDYTQAPIYKQIKKLPERYSYLEKITLYRIQYLSDGLLVTGLMAVPKKEGKFPVVLYNRGGNREFGALIVATGTDVLAPIAAEGFVVLATNYRGNGGSDGKEEFGGSDVMDVVNLAKCCSVFPKADNSRLALFGVSRGGMMNYLVLKNLEKYGLNVKCSIQLGGITDLAKTIEYHPDMVSVCEELIPNYASTKNKSLQDRSAVFWVNDLPATCPLLILHGMEDASVTYLQIPVFADSLDRANIPYQLVSFAAENHGIIHHQEQVKAYINEWLKNYLVEEKSFKVDEKRILIPEK